MKTLVISKPTYSYILPLVEFPSDGDNFFIQKSIDVISSHGSIIALALGKYGVDTDFTGAVGGDELSNKILEIFEKHQVKTKYMERVYAEKTAASYKIYNQKTNRFTTITEAANKLTLSKYKYEFIPDTIIMDDRDYNANLAAINNYPNANLIFIGDKYTKESSTYCNKCKYVISTLSFASGATGITDGLNKSKNIVSLFQKYIDLYNSKLIIKLDNFDILYCVDDEVRLIKNVNKNIANKDSIYYSVLVYFIINNYDIENAIKLTNKVMLSSNNEIDLLLDIPDYSVVETVIKEFEATKVNNQTQQNLTNQTVMQQQVVQNNVNQNIQQNNINHVGMEMQMPNQQVTQSQQNMGQVQNLQQPNMQQQVAQNNIQLQTDNINNNGVNNG